MPKIKNKNTLKKERRKQTSKKVVKQTSKKKQPLIHGGDKKNEPLKEIKSNVRIILSFPTILYLPSSLVFDDKKVEDYLLMFELKDLKKVIENNEKYQRSITVHNLFNKESFELNGKNEINFKYGNFSCDDLISRSEREGGLKMLFESIIECNVYQKMEKILNQSGGNNDELENEINKGAENALLKEEEEEEKKRNEEKKKQEEEEEKKKQEEEEEKERNEEKKKQEEEEKRRENMMNTPDMDTPDMDTPDMETPDMETPDMDTPDMDTPDMETPDMDTPDMETPDMETPDMETPDMETSNNKDEYDKMLEIENKMKLKKLEEERNNIIEKEKKLNEKLDVFKRINELKKVNLNTNGDLILHNIDWFNICCKIDTFDEYYEKIVDDYFNELNIIINYEEVLENIQKIISNEEYLIIFKRMLKKRLVNNSDVDEVGITEPIKYFKNHPGNVNTEIKKRDKILKLYPEYKTFLKSIYVIPKYDILMVLIFCDIRLSILSRYISLETLRRKNIDNREKHISDILDTIILSDKKYNDGNISFEENQRLINSGKELYDKNINKLKINILKQENNKISRQEKYEKELEEYETKKKDDSSFFERFFGRNDKNVGNVKEQLKDNVENLTPIERELIKNLRVQNGGSAISDISGISSKGLKEYCERIKKDGLKSEDINNNFEKCF